MTESGNAVKTVCLKSQLKTATERKTYSHDQENTGKTTWLCKSWWAYPGSPANNIEVEKYFQKFK